MAHVHLAVFGLAIFCLVSVSAAPVVHKSLAAPKNPVSHLFRRANSTTTSSSATTSSDNSCCNWVYDKTMKQTITFANVNLAADFKGDVKKVYETAYGITINIVADRKTGVLKAGCTLTSTAVTNGTGTAVTFDSKVASLIHTGETEYFLLSPDTGYKIKNFATRFNAYFKDTNTALGKNVTVPATADITWAAATSVQLKTGFGKDLTDAVGLALGIILGIVFGSLVLLIVLIVICCYCCCKKNDSPPVVVMATNQLVTAEQPAGAKYMKNGVWYDEKDQPITA